jgi:hypothetical protein
MKINDNVKRQDTQTGTWSSPIHLETQALLDHHRGLAESGIKYVTIHTTDTAECVACEA